jgi:hypothetical protein
MEKSRLNSNEPIDFTGIRVTIATPCYGGAMSHRYVHSLTYTIPELLKNGIGFNFLTIPNDSIIATARNRLVDQFLQDPEGTHLWFIDADMGWRPEEAIRLFATKRPFVGGAGMRKQEDPTFCALLENPAKWCANTGMVKAISIGTGCVVIAREVFEKIKEADPDNWYYANGEPDKKIYQFFENKVHKNFLWTEDYTFCNKWRKLGGEIWVDPGFYLEHIGQKAWCGKFGDALKPISNYFIESDLVDDGRKE